MPIETSIDSRTGLRTHVVTGSFTLDELENELRDAYRRPDYRPEANSLCDLREAGAAAFTDEEIQSVVDTVLEHRGAPPGVRTALVVARDLSFGLARMFAHQLEAKSHSNVMVFRDMDEAMAWLEGDEKE